MKRIVRDLSVGLLLAALTGVGLHEAATADAIDKAIPVAAVDAPKTSAPASETAVLAGGCFWGMQGVFEHVRGVTRVVSGYSGGAKATAHYELVGTETTGHAESVQITFDPRIVSFGEILRVYFSVAHDPT
jgi:peptide-methionine (S)-S-oxide reductase